MNAVSKSFAMTPEQTAIRDRWQAEFDDGAKCAFTREFLGERESGGYPVGFHRWLLERRNAWFAGFSIGFHMRLQDEKAR
jgi:hypothetical protein